MTHDTEQSVQQECLEIAPRLGMFLGRNNSGAFSAKQPPSPGTRWGWCNHSKALNDVFKTPDLLGWTSIVITPEMIGKRVAVFTMAEIKDPNWKLQPSDKRAQAQLNCINKGIEAGAIAGFVTHVSQLTELKQAFLTDIELGVDVEQVIIELFKTISSADTTELQQLLVRARECVNIHANS